MKKISILLAVFTALLIAMPVSAQVNLGVIGGLNLANLSFDPDPTGVDVKNLTAFGIGGVINFGLGTSLKVQLEPMYLQKGAKAEGGGLESEIKAGYLEVPIMIQYPFGDGDTKFFVMAGPEIGYLLSAEQDGVDFKDDVKSIDFGIAFGGGVSMPMGNNTVFVEGRYSLGLSDLNDDPSDDDTKIKTKGIQIMAGITFPFGG